MQAVWPKCDSNTRSLEEIILLVEEETTESPQMVVDQIKFMISEVDTAVDSRRSTVTY